MANGARLKLQCPRFSCNLSSCSVLGYWLSGRNSDNSTQCQVCKPHYHWQIARWVLLGSGAAGRPVGAKSAREPHTSTMATADSTEGYQQAHRLSWAYSASQANLKHGRQTRDELAAQRHAAKVGRRVRGELKRIKRRIVDAGLMPDD